MVSNDLPGVLVSYAYAWSLACLVSYAYLCGRLPVVSYAYALLPGPIWSPMSTWTPRPTYGLLGLPMIWAYLCGLLCLPGLLSLLMVS